MNGDGFMSVLAIGGFIGAVVAVVLWLAIHQVDSFDCTLKCNGAHNLKYQDKCYCEVDGGH